ncbi:MAG: hypothetical protein R6X34_29430 [Chloroflexota bacterium]
MTSRKLSILVLWAVVLLLLAACGGGGGGGGCEHLSCAPQTNAMEKVTDMLEDAEDGIIDEGESELGDAVIRAAEWLWGQDE